MRRGPGVSIVGSGALGTLLASFLTRSRDPVRVLARRASAAEALLREAPNALVTEDASALVPAALLLLCVKAYQTEEAATLLAGPLASAPTPVVSLQNGWGHMDLLARLLHGIRLVAGATTIGAYWDDEGRFHASQAGETLFAPWSADAAAPAAEAARRFTEAGLRARIAPHAPEILWRKLVLNAAVNPLTALHAVTNGAVRTTPALWAEAREAAREGVAVGAARGYIVAEFDPDPLLDRLLRDTAENRSSMAQDLARGRRTEADAIVGAIVREGRAAGVETPVLASLGARLAEAEARR